MEERTDWDDDNCEEELLWCFIGWVGCGVGFFRWSSTVLKISVVRVRV